MSEIRDPATIPAMVEVLLNDPAYEVDAHKYWMKARFYIVRRVARDSLRKFQWKGIQIGREAEEALERCYHTIPDEFQILDQPLEDRQD